MAQTPMMAQFCKIKDEYKDSILFYRVGDFYEMFYDDARIASRELELTLTRRGKDSGGDIPLAGVPYHAAEQYIGRLVKKGYSVAVCDQVEDPKEAKGIVKREVTRVVTPGTIMEESLLDSSQNNFLCAISERGMKIGLAWADITTSDFYSEEFNGGSSFDELMSEIAMIDPKEILMTDSLIDDNEFRLQLKTLLGDKVIIRPFMVDYNLKESINILLAEFELMSLDGFGLSEYSQGIIASAQIIDYLKNTQKEHKTKFVKIIPKKNDYCMHLDPTTRNNLELTKTMRGEDDRGTLFSILNKTRTAMGTRTLKEWIHQPLLSIDSIMKRQNSITHFFKNRILMDSIISSLKNIYDMERLLSRLSFGSGGGKDLRMLSNSLKGCMAIKEELVKDSGLSVIYENIEEFYDLINLIDNAIVEEPPFSVREGRIFRDGYSEELDELRKIKSGGSEWMANLVENERNRTGIKTLKVKYNKVFGYYIEVTKANVQMVPENYIRKQTLTNAERYFTPELKEMENKILGASDRINKLEYELFEEIRSKVLENSSELLKMAKIVAEIDSLISLALVAIENNYIAPEICENNDISIIGGRHPVVEKMVDINFIPNNTILDSETRLQIITGPNMAGKSTYIRQVAILVLMAQIGSYIPAESAKIGICDRIFTRVGASDNLYRGQSTFMVEMVETANILNNATKNSLIILDEIGRGTSTFDGISIAWAIADFLAKGSRRIRGARTLFATHYHELTQLEGVLPGVKNFNIAVVEENGEIVFIRKIVSGGADKSYGIHVASLAGLPSKVVEKAKIVLKSLESDSNHNYKREIKLQEDENQMDLFAEVEENEIVKLVNSVDPDSLSPREALEFLYKLKKM